MQRLLLALSLTSVFSLEVPDGVTAAPVTAAPVTAAPDPAAPVTAAPVTARANCGTACQDATAWINAGCCTGC